jgi:hypothetical protein
MARNVQNDLIVALRAGEYRRSIIEIRIKGASFEVVHD